jgi:hypothetical protein
MLFGIDWLVVGLLLLAGVRAVADAVVDGIAQFRNPGGEVPSVIKRQARADLAQQNAAARVELAERQRAAGIPPAPGQAAADRLARFIADPPPWPPWVLALASYLGLLLSDRLARARRKHVRKEKVRQARQRGERPTAGGPGEHYCDSCDVNPVDRKGGTCSSCAPVVKKRCPGCGVHVPAAELRNHDQCETCRRPADGPPEPANPDVPLRLELPAWMPTD